MHLAEERVGRSGFAACLLIFPLFFFSPTSICIIIGIGISLLDPGDQHKGMGGGVLLKHFGFPGNAGTQRDGETELSGVMFSFLLCLFFWHLWSFGEASFYHFWGCVVGGKEFRDRSGQQNRLCACPAREESGASRFHIFFRFLFLPLISFASFFFLFAFLYVGHWGIRGISMGGKVGFV